MLSQFEIPKSDPEIAIKIQAALDIKTKPPGSLGRLEALAVQMGVAQNTPEPSAENAHLLLFAADHGLVAEGVSAWPSEVTAQMVKNFLSGGAASNVFARSNNVGMTIVDGGVVGDLLEDPGLVRANIKRGTNNSMHEDAMSASELEEALNFGAALAAQRVEAGDHIIALGEMGIGNTSSAALVTHAITGIDLELLAGPGAGLDESGVSKKTEIMRRAAARRPAPLDPLDAMAAYGGLEIAMMAGAVIGTASRNGVVLVDGFIATSAALVAAKARPESLSHMVFSHRSKEPGHRAMLEAIPADPLLDLDLRLGEGTGALLAVPLLRNACAMLAEMATFESAGVSGKS